MPLFALSACSTPQLQPNVLEQAFDVALAPYETFELCADLLEDDRLDYAFDSVAQLHFDIRYRQRNAVVIPYSRDDIAAEAGVYRVMIAEKYCLSWEAGAQPTSLDYRVRIVRRTQ